MIERPDGAPVRALVALGTRPEAIKLLPVIRALRADPRFRARVVFTGQHRDLVEPILHPFGIRADEDLDVMVPGQSLNDLVVRATARLDAVFAREAPDVVLVQGDTTSAMCAAVAAFHRRTMVAHVEAGLRSRDRFNPYPEESNRRMIAAVADLHLAPTAGAADNLLREGVALHDVVVTGNTAVDALLAVLDDAAPARAPASTWGDGRMVLVTVHRRETWAPRDQDGRSSRHARPLLEVLRGVRRAATRNSAVEFVYPVHPNPKVREAATEVLGDLPNVRLVEPLAYVPFVRAMRRATVILTDSGGIQEEAPSLGVPCLVVRRCTERPEGVASGHNKLVGLASARIAAELQGVLDAPPRRPEKLPCPSPYGDGRASARVVQAVLHKLRGERAPEAFAAPVSVALPPERSPTQTVRRARTAEVKS